MLEKIYNESPSVFRKIISFGFVLGISKKWTENFDSMIFNSIFSAAYGNTDGGEDIDFDEMTYKQKRAASEESQKKIRINRDIFRSKIDEFNNMISVNNLVLFNNVYKEPVREPYEKLSKYLSDDK